MRVGPVRGWCLGLMLVLVAVGGCVEKASFAVGDVGSDAVGDSLDASGSSDIEGIDGVVDGEVGEQDVKDATEDVEIAPGDIVDVGLDVLDAEVDDASDVELVDAVDVTDDEVGSEDVHDVDELDLPPCEPSCEGIECGDDGCGGECWFVEHPCEGPDCENQVCQDNNQCTVDFCNQNGQCDWNLAEMAECCDGHEDCRPGGLWDDENPSTLDYCEDYQCVHESNPAYCDDSGAFPCAADNDVCTEDLCDLDLNVCVHNAIEDCCYNDGECDDGNVCTLDNCSMPEGYPTCVHTNVPGECDDQIVCTVDDACVDGGCVGQPSDELCDDDNECSTDTCDPILDCQHDAVEDALPCGQFPLEQCLSGTCSCTPDCVDKECGPDGCGGTCGQCGPDQVCINGVCPAEGFQCDDGNNVPWDGCTYGQVTEYVLVEGYQTLVEIDLAIEPDGTMLLVGRGNCCQTLQDICLQRFDAHGNPLPELAPLTSCDGSSNRNPEIAVLPNGDFVVVWDHVPCVDCSTSCNDCDADVAMVMFSHEGVPLTEMTIVNSTLLEGQTGGNVLAWPDGHFIVVWNSYPDGSTPDNEGQDGFGSGVYGQLFDANGDRIGSEFQMNQQGYGQESHSNSILRDDGNLVVAWRDYWRSDFRVFDSDGTPETDDVILNGSDSSWTPSSVATTSGGALLFVGDDLRGQWVHPWAVLDGALFDMCPDCTTSDPIKPQLARLSDNSMVLSWRGDSETGEENVYVDKLGIDGVVSDEPIPANTCEFTGVPLLRSLPSGGFVVLWTTPYTADTCDGIMVQRFDAEGNRLYR